VVVAAAGEGPNAAAAVEEVNPAAAGPNEVEAGAAAVSPTRWRWERRWRTDPPHPRSRRDGHVAGQPPLKNPRERAVLLAVTEPVAPKAPGGVGASRGEV
jgi:hypothetical protein